MHLNYSTLYPQVEEEEPCSLPPLPETVAPSPTRNICSTLPGYSSQEKCFLSLEDNQWPQALPHRVLDTGSTASLPFRSPLCDAGQDGISLELISGICAGPSNGHLPLYHLYGNMSRTPWPKGFVFKHMGLWGWDITFGEQLEKNKLCDLSLCFTHFILHLPQL